MKMRSVMFGGYRDTGVRLPVMPRQLPVMPRQLPVMQRDEGAFVVDRAPAGARFATVGGRAQAKPGVDAEPAQRLPLPVAAVMVDPRELGALGVAAQDQIGERAPREVRRRHAVADVAAGPRQTGGTVETDRWIPVAGTPSGPPQRCVIVASRVVRERARA